MKKHSRISSGLKGAALAFALMLALHPAYAAGTTVVTPASTDWWFLQETPTGSGAFVSGPGTPPLGTGSVQFTVDGTGGEDFGTFDYAGTRLSAITSLGYSTYRVSGSSDFAPSLQLDIDTDVTDANTAWQGRLVYEPYYTHTVSTGVWQTWNPLDNAGVGNWWFTGAPGNAKCPMNNPCTWSEVLADFPNAGIRSAGPNTGALQLKAGGGWAGGFVGNADALSIGVNNVVTTYDFELPSVSTPSFFAQNNGQAYSTNFDTFSPGEVENQFGWTSGHGSSFCPLYDVYVVPNTYGYPTFGTQSLRISDAITCGSYNDQTFSTSLPNEAGETSAGTSTFSGGTRQPYFQAQWDFASTKPGSEQPGLSVVASPDRGDTMRMSWIQMEDTDTGLQVNFQEYKHALANFVVTPIATGLSRTVPHTIKITMQFVDGAGNDIVQVYVDGALAYTGTSWEDYYRDFAGGIPFPVDSIMFRVAGTAIPADSGNGFLIDNFSSETGPVPASPATLHVIKLVVNANGGTAIPSDFSIHLDNAGVDVAGSPQAGTSTPGTLYTLAPGTYTVSEDANALYTETFAGDCDASGSITLAPGDDKICTLINTDLAPPAAVAPTAAFAGSGSGALIVYPPHIVPLIGILKVPNPLALPGGAGPVTYTYSVWNVGTQQALADVAVADDRCSPVRLLSGDTNANGLLDPGETWKYSCATTLATTTINTAVATGYSNDPYHTPAIATAISTVVVGPVPGLPDTGLIAPLISVIKIPSRLTPFPFGGGEVTYTYTVTNPGVIPMNNVTLVDNTCAPAALISGDRNNNGTLDPGETWTYTCTTDVPVSTRNTATATGHANGFLALAYAFATVLVSAPGFPDTGAPAASAASQQVLAIPVDLQEGSWSNGVSMLQTFLIAQDAGPAARALAATGTTSYFGALTRAALAEFQANVGISPAQGYFGPITRAYLSAND